IPSAQRRGSATAESISHAVQHGTEQLQWQRPRNGLWKCNVDASVSQSSSTIGWGWCMQNSDGYFVAAGTNKSM
ncbi:hypothetical protein A2U01_0094785, partial [Trifolium medium]|nr:hypothetical protein [Trifolium medium]